MQRHTESTRKRVAQLVDVLRSKIYPERRPLDKLLVSTAATDRISWHEAQRLDYRPAKLGEQFGPLWATFWFQGEATLPDSWSNKRVDLIWVAHYCESTLWLNGNATQALNLSFAERTEAPLTQHASAGEKIDFQLELACSTAYGEWPPEKPYKQLLPYVLDNAEVAVFDPLAWAIYIDYLVAQQLEADLATTNSISDRAFSAELLYELNRFANTYDAEDTETWRAAHAILLDLLKHRNATHTHEISAVGEGHLDIAWCWPLAETWRKIIRTASNQVGLMDEYPEYRFVCSQACLYDELRKRLPELYGRVKAKVASKQWIPVGGTWVEPDCNMPAAESLVRQFLFGQRFFQQEFGFLASECWLQDSFGYCAQLPQIMRSAGIWRFVTQKLFRGHVQPRHRLFSWEGLDGSRVIAHLPTTHTFSNQLTVGGINKAAREYTDNDRSARSLLSFGWGDGGGGPTRQMIEIVKTLKDVEGAPRVVMRNPSQFFELVEADLSKRPPVTISGELYFARHRGTYTSQSRTKKAMRQAERLLHEVEFLSAVSLKLGLKNYPQDELNQLWKTVLLNQHHDILTGTSITLVHEEAVKQLEDVSAQCRQLRADALDAMTATADAFVNLRSVSTTVVAHSERRATAERSSSSADDSARGAAASTVTSTSVKERGPSSLPVNTTVFARNEVARMPDGTMVMIEVPSYGVGKVVSLDDESTVTVRDSNGRIVLENMYILAEFNSSGDLLRILDRVSNRDALSGPGNRLQIYDDHPLDYDAWEIEHYHHETVKDCLPSHSYKIKQDRLCGEIEFERKIGVNSSLRQIVRLECQSRRLEFHCHVDWKEEHKILKVLFPAAILSGTATYDTQFGAVERPTHYNSPEDQTRFEVVGHKWADLSEHGFGLALLSDSKYGFSIYGNEMRISLLRASRSPDPTADLGQHEFAYAVMPHQKRWQDGGVVAESFKFNRPIVWATNVNEVAVDETISFAGVDDRNLVLDTIKKAEDSSRIILRLYECHGARGVARVRLNLPFTSARLSNILEDEGNPVAVEEGLIIVPYQPFEIITLIVD